MKLSRFASSICFALIAAWISSDAVAQDASASPAPSRKKPAANAEAAAPATVVSPTPPPAEPKKKRGFFKRMFGGGKEKGEPASEAASAAPVAEPVLTPAASPSPTAQKKKKREATAETSEKLKGKNKTAKADDDSDATRSAPKVVKATPSPDSTQTSKVPDTVDSLAASANSTPLPDSLPPLDDDATGKPANPGKEPAPVAKNKPDDFLPPEVPLTATVPETVKSNPLNQPISLVDPVSTPTDGVASSSAPESEEDAVESAEEQTLARIRFKKIKAQALENGKVRDLKVKADSAPSEDARYTALKEYYPALFAQMRKLDASFSKGIDRMEAAANRRLARMAADGAGGKAEPSATGKSGG